MYTRSKPPVPGLIRSLDDASANTHPQPILVHPRWFRTLCVPCGALPVGPQRSTVALALVDRDKHARSHSSECDECGMLEHTTDCSHHWTQTIGAP